MVPLNALVVTKETAQDYISARGYLGWPSTEAAQEQALRRGQDYIAARYNGRWSADFDADSVPIEVQYAIIEAAAVEAAKPGSLNPTSTPATDKVLVEVKGIVWERVKGAGGADSYIPRIAAVEGLLRGLVRSGATGWVARA